MTGKPLITLKEKWEEAIGMDITDEDWSRALGYPQKISRNTRLKYLQFNYLHQTYLTPEKSQQYMEGIGGIVLGAGQRRRTLFIWFGHANPPLLIGN